MPMPRPPAGSLSAEIFRKSAMDETPAALDVSLAGTLRIRKPFQIFAGEQWWVEAGRTSRRFPKSRLQKVLWPAATRTTCLRRCHRRIRRKSSPSSDHRRTRRYFSSPIADRRFGPSNHSCPKRDADFRRSIRTREKSEWPDAVSDADEHDAFAGQLFTAVISIRRGARAESAAVNPNQNRNAVARQISRASRHSDTGCPRSSRRVASILEWDRVQSWWSGARRPISRRVVAPASGGHRRAVRQTECRDRPSIRLRKFPAPVLVRP